MKELFFWKSRITLIGHGERNIGIHVKMAAAPLFALHQCEQRLCCVNSAQNDDGWELGPCPEWRGLMTMWKNAKCFMRWWLMFRAILAYYYRSISTPQGEVVLFGLRCSTCGFSNRVRHCSSWYCVTLSRHPSLRIANTPISFLLPLLPSLPGYDYLRYVLLKQLHVATKIRSVPLRW